MMQKTISIAALLVAVELFAIAGCGPDRPTTVPVGGKVTYQGKPVPEGRIMFYPKHGRPAIGALGPDGSYRLTTFERDDGATPGTYVVTIEAKHESGRHQPKSLEDEVQKGFSPGTTTITWLVPKKYANRATSALTAEVKPGENAIDFDLP